jgi:phage terminase large subunit
MTNAAPIQASELFQWNYERIERARSEQHGQSVPVIINQGGTSSGKTYSILQALFAYCCNFPTTNGEPTVVTVAGRTVPHLKHGAMRDAENIALAFLQHIKDFSVTDKRYRFKNGALLEFSSFETEQDARGGKRHVLFVNEANGISHGVFDQLRIRTKSAVVLDYNPDSEFWVHSNYKADAMKRGNFSRSTYKNNKHLPPSLVATIESKRDNASWWRVYGEGRTGKIEGLVFEQFEQGWEWPQNVEPMAYGLDFGYSHNCALVMVGRRDGVLVAQEELYEPRLTSGRLVERLNDLSIPKHAEIWADSSRPEMIAALVAAGYNCQAVEKGGGSVKAGIDLLNCYKLLLIGKSLWAEAMGYRWKVHANGQALEEPVKENDDAVDAMRYAVLMAFGKPAKSWDYVSY